MWGRQRRAATLAAAALVLTAGACIQDIGVPPGQQNARAIAVNSAGDVVVRAFDPEEGAVGSVFARDGEWTQPGVDTPGLDVTTISYESINDSGGVVGELFLSHPNPSNPQRGNDMQFAWDPQRGLREIVLNGGNRVVPADIADDGSIAARGLVGTAAFGSMRGYLIDGATLARRELGPLTLGGGSTASAVNTRREVVGVSVGRYVVWAPPFYWPVALSPPTPTEQADSRAIDINDRGEIVAAMYPPSPAGGQAAEPWYGLYWDAQRATTRMPSGFLPEAIADDGTVVGAVWTLPTSPGQQPTSPRAATWTPGDAQPELLAVDEDRPDSQATAVAGDHVVGWHAPPGAPYLEQDTAVRWTR